MKMPKTCNKHCDLKYRWFSEVCSSISKQNTSWAHTCLSVCCIFQLAPTKAIPGIQVTIRLSPKGKMIPGSHTTRVPHPLVSTIGFVLVGLFLLIPLLPQAGPPFWTASIGLAPHSLAPSRPYTPHQTSPHQLCPLSLLPMTWPPRTPYFCDLDYPKALTEEHCLPCLAPPPFNIGSDLLDTPGLPPSWFRPPCACHPQDELPHRRYFISYSREN